MWNDRRTYSQNLVHLLQNRESGLSRNVGNCNRRASEAPPLLYEREFYKSITPNLTVQNIDIPPGYLRKFTPDGSKLLAFDQLQRSLQVYKYKGVTAGATSLLNDAGVGSSEFIRSPLLRNNLFGKLFDLIFMIRLCQGDNGSYHLHREFSIFIENGRYVLLVAVSHYNGSVAPSDYICCPDLFDKLDIFSYIFYIVDLKLGCVSDKICFPYDAICISHNQGVSVYGQTIVILSKLKQSIYLFELVNGRLVKHETIGPRPRGCTFMDQGVENFNLHTKLPITHIKQRVLVFLYRQIEENSLLNRNDKCLDYQAFYKKFAFMEHMIIEKMQLVNSDLLLLRYEERTKLCDTVPISPIGELQPMCRLYVFYTITREEVIGVYQDDSVELLKLILLFNDRLCNVRSLQLGDVPSWPSHNVVRQILSNPTESPHILRQSALRFNPTIPISTQSFTVSPYLNHNKFIYEYRHISPLERPKHCVNEPIVFRDRRSKTVKFRLRPKARMRSNLFEPLELCAFIFHPFEPLAFSIQNLTHSHSYVFNLHLYNHSTIVNANDM